MFCKTITEEVLYNLKFRETMLNITKNLEYYVDGTLSLRANTSCHS